MMSLYDMALVDNGKRNLYTGLSLIHGRGLFTNVTVLAHTILCRRLGLRDVLSLRDKRAIIGVDGVDPATPEDSIFKHINHCCQPNAQLTDTGCLVNVNILTEDAEITIDYAIILPGSNWDGICTCGMPSCRKIIKA
ncbi:hypothetical protein D0C36_04610 [Mucilaginibacter conchicola]|uniref:SET domain-containing protein n=1 Tax=Mucilaginibacter conchicola TaxID=2303333 RepID=A0A372NY66_9SPHI|nr:hypothetical protein [Mucilaginibacter conchicola]RFZ94821.1 hypothetical protein D0C36_04610 [Mucilaginibacter conchicola]